MDTILLDGRKMAELIERGIALSVAKLADIRRPGLAVILAGDHAPSHIYVGRKIAACQRVGIQSKQFLLDSSTSKETLYSLIQALNIDPTVDGILVQLPLPFHFSPVEVASWIDPSKDVDGLHPLNQGNLLCGQLNGLIPCTPLGIKRLLDGYGISVSGKHVVIFGRSNIVGKPMAALLMQTLPGFDATVTVLHRAFHDLASVTRLADILIVAAGQPHIIRRDMVKKGAVIVDVGITKRVCQTNGKHEIVGDVFFEELLGHASYMTPVPGGVGPMTIAMLLENTWKSFVVRNHLKFLDFKA